MKYARFIPRDDGTTQVVDLLDLGAPPYDQRPLLGCTTDADLLNKLYSPELIEQWQAAGQHFGAVAQGVVDHSTFHGGDPMDIANYTAPNSVRPPKAPPPLDGDKQSHAMVRGRAAELDKKGKHLEAIALRATIGE